MIKKRQTASQRKQAYYSPLTPKLAIQLAAPHTWVAAFIGVMLSCTYVAITYSGTLNLLLSFVLLVICLLMQSSVNVFNDYFDYVKGTDSEDNSSKDAFDAVLVYNKINPRSVLMLAVVFLIFAAILGIYVIYVSGWIPLVIGIVGALVVVAYSGGKTPISYLPIGEFISGGVMGLLIPLACTYVLSGIFDLKILLISLPLAIGIGMILATNNTCDIEKDIPAHRKTLAISLGRKKALSTYRAVYIVFILSVLLLVAIFYTKGLPFLVFMLIGIFPVARALLNNPLIQQSRDAAMSQIVMSNVILTSFYCIALLSSNFIMWI